MPASSNEPLDTPRFIQAAHDLEHFLDTSYGSFLLVNTELHARLRDFIREHAARNPRPNHPNPPSTRPTRRSREAEIVEFPHDWATDRLVPRSLLKELNQLLPDRYDREQSTQQARTGTTSTRTTRSNSEPTTGQTSPPETEGHQPHLHTPRGQNILQSSRIGVRPIHRFSNRAVSPVHTTSDAFRRYREPTARSESEELEVENPPGSTSEHSNTSSQELLRRTRTSRRTTGHTEDLERPDFQRQNLDMNDEMEDEPPNQLQALLNAVTTMAEQQRRQQESITTLTTIINGLRNAQA